MKITFISIFGAFLLGLIPWFYWIDEPPIDLKPLPPLSNDDFELHIPTGFQPVLDSFEVEVNRLMRYSSTPGAAVAIVKDSNLVYLKGFGLKTQGVQDSIDVHTVFRLASVSKCFAGLLTGLLVSDSILTIDAPIARYWPEFSIKDKAGKSGLTLQHVLSHTTGFPYHAYTNLVEAGLSFDRLMEELQQVKATYPPGKEYTYQNVAFSISGKVIEKMTHQSYQQQLKDKIFRPLGMVDASVSYQEIKERSNRASPHLILNGKGYPTPIHSSYYNVAPAGGVNASIYDMAHWMIAMLGYRKDVVPLKTLDLLYTPIIKTPVKNGNYRKYKKVNASYYGLGFRILCYAQDTLIYHGGYVNHFRSEVALNKRTGMGICILSNAPGRITDEGIPLFFNLLEQYGPWVDGSMEAEKK